MALWRRFYREHVPRQDPFAHLATTLRQSGITGLELHLQGDGVVPENGYTGCRDPSQLAWESGRQAPSTLLLFLTD